MTEFKKYFEPKLDLIDDYSIRSERAEAQQRPSNHQISGQKPQRAEVLTPQTRRETLTGL